MKKDIKIIVFLVLILSKRFFLLLFCWYIGAYNIIITENFI